VWNVTIVRRKGGVHEACTAGRDPAGHRSCGRALCGSARRPTVCKYLKTGGGAARAPSAGIMPQSAFLEKSATCSEPVCRCRLLWGAAIPNTCMRAQEVESTVADIQQLGTILNIEARHAQEIVTQEPR
jgi:hypothetical protein